MIDGICSNINCTNREVGFGIDEENQYCPKCGCRLQPVDEEKAPADLHDVLTRYEGAVNATERDGDDSEAAVMELKEAREALLTVLRQALAAS
jgi:hypothetical protein